MKLPVAPQSRRALMEWSSLVFVVPIATGRSREVSHVSKVLIVTNFIRPYLHQFFDNSHGLKASLKPLRRPFD